MTGLHQSRCDDQLQPARHVRREARRRAPPGSIGNDFVSACLGDDPSGGEVIVFPGVLSGRRRSGGSGVLDSARARRLSDGVWRLVACPFTACPAANFFGRGLNWACVPLIRKTPLRRGAASSDHPFTRALTRRPGGGLPSTATSGRSSDQNSRRLMGANVRMQGADTRNVAKFIRRGMRRRKCIPLS